MSHNSSVTIVVLLVSFALAICNPALGFQGCDFPAIFNFGDSNSDTGGGAAAFFPVAAPFGETYFHKPAERRSDGRLIIDFIGKDVIRHQLPRHIHMLLILVPFDITLQLTVTFYLITYYYQFHSTILKGMNTVQSYTTSALH